MLNNEIKIKKKFLILVNNVMWGEAYKKTLSFGLFFFC